MTSLAALSLEELADGICLRAGRIAAAQAELLLWIAEFDRREGWAGPGMLSCAHWLSWRIGLTLGTARDQVRVARRLEDLPQLAAAFGDGQVSYSKVRAITRVAELDDGIDWIAMARHSSAAQLEKLVRGVSRARVDEAAERDPEAAAWQLRTRTRYDDRGNFVLTISGPAQLLPVITAGLDAKKAQLQQAAAAEAAAAPPPSPASEPCAAPAAGTVLPMPHSPPGPAAPAEVAGLDEQAPGWPDGTTRRLVLEAMDGVSRLQRELRAEQGSPDTDTPVRDAPPRSAPHATDTGTDTGTGTGTAATVGATTTTDPPAVTDAEALLALAQDALQTEAATRPDAARRRRPQLTAQVDPLSGWARLADGELLPPSSLRSVLRTLPGRGGLLRLRPLTDADLRRHDLGRTAREVSTALRELLGALDGERCRFPGCTRHRNLHAHHVRFWRDGGATDLANLVLVCSRHHTVLHAQGFQLALHVDRSLEVRTADGTPVRHHPTQPWGDPAALATGRGRRVSAETLPPDHSHPRLALHYAVSVLMAQAA